MINRSVFPKIGMFKIEQLEAFINKCGWKCSYCNNDEFIIEEYANTGLCSVSATPYVALANNANHFSQTGNGFPAYTVLCSRCFAVTKYHAVYLLESLLEK